MTDALWLAFSERVCVDDQLRLALLPRGDGASSLAQLGERNLSTLASIAAIEERRADSADAREARVSPYLNPRGLAFLDLLDAVAREHGATPAQVSLAWLIARPGLTAPIVGASKPHHLQDAIAAASLKLEDAELKALSEPYKPHPVLGHR